MDRIQDFQVSEASWLESRESYATYLNYDLRKKLADNRAFGNCRMSQRAWTSKPDDGLTTYFFKQAGDVMMRYKCVRVTVDLRVTKKCFEMLPVHFGKYDRFIDPNTKNLVTIALEARCSPILPVYKTTEGAFIQQVRGGFRLIKPTLIPRLDTTSDRAVAESGVNEETEESFYSISEILEGQKDLTRGTLESERRAIMHNDLTTDASAVGPSHSYVTDIKSRIMAAVEARWKALSLELTQIGAGGGLVFLASVAIYLSLIHI